MTLKSIADLKRATTTGAVVHFEHLTLPDRSGPRTVLKAQTNRWMFSWPEGMENPHGYAGGWLNIPKRNEVEFSGNAATLLSEGKAWLRITVSPS